MGYRIERGTGTGISPIRESECSRDITNINSLNILFSLKDKIGRTCNAAGMRQLPSPTAVRRNSYATGGRLCLKEEERL